MDYKKMMGYSKKKKVSKPKVNKIIEGVKKQMNETFMGIQTAKDNPPFKTKKQIQEGPAYEYAKVFSKFEKAYMQLQKAIDELGRYTTKKTGEKTDQKIIEKQWKKQVIPFYKLMKSWIRGKM